MADEPVDVGRVGRAHGLDGSFYVLRPEADLLEVGRELTVAGTARAVTRRAGTATRPILRLAGIETRAAAEALRGELLLVGRSALPPLEADEYWAHELAGCAVVDGPRRIGVVRRLVGLPSCEALEVARDGPDLLVPLVKDAVRRVDVAARVVEIDLAFLGDEFR